MGSCPRELEPAGLKRLPPSPAPLTFKLGKLLTSVEQKMLHKVHAVLGALVFVQVVQAQFQCPEPNGRFPDPVYCDKYYLCRKGVPEEKNCLEGLLFDYSIPNREKCVLPHNVKCKDRKQVQERSPDTHPRCPKANGVFNFDDETVCDKYIRCPALPLCCSTRIPAPAIVRISSANSQDGATKKMSTRRLTDSNAMGVRQSAPGDSYNSIQCTLTQPAVGITSPAILEGNRTSLVAQKEMCSTGAASSARTRSRCRSAGVGTSAWRTRSVPTTASLTAPVDLPQETMLMV